MSFKRNILINYIGTGWSIISIYAFIPFYLKYLDEDSYGLIMFASSMQAIIFLLDAGFSSTLRRKLAWGGKDIKNLEDGLSFLYGVERFYLIVFSIICIITIFFAMPISENWLNIKSISAIQVAVSIVLIAIGAFLQMFFSLYTGGLIAIEEQVESNIIKILMSLVRNGFVIILIYYYPSALLFLTWQILIALIFSLVARRKILIYLKSEIGKSISKIRVNKKVVLDALYISLPFFILSILSTINYQTDKIVISKLLPIAELGVYTTLFALGQASVSVCGPIATALSPRMIREFSLGNIESLEQLFHKFARLTSIVAFSVGFCLIFYRLQIVRFWTNNELMVMQADNIGLYLVLAGMFLSSQVLPYNLGIASFKLNPIIISGIVNIMITIPSYYYFVQKDKLLGASLVWFFSCLILLIVNVYFYLKKSLPNNFIKWFVNDFLIVFIVCFLTAYFLNFIFDRLFNHINIIVIMLIGLISLIVNIIFFEPKLIFRSFNNKIN